MQVAAVRSLLSARVLRGLLALPAIALAGIADAGGDPPGWSSSMGPGSIASMDDSHWWDGFGTRDQAGLNGDVLAMTVFQGKLVVGGYPTRAGGVPARRIAMWDGISWSALGGGIDDYDCPEIECLGRVQAMTVWDSSLVVGGNFPSVGGGLPANHIARWDGERWHPLGTGVDAPVWALTIYKGDLIAAGEFTRAGGRVVNYVAAWDGDQWHPIGEGFNWIVSLGGLIVHGDDLIASGGFTRSGQIEVKYLARWDGTSWGPLGSGVSNSAALCLLEGNLVVGDVSRAGGMEIWGMAMWDGSSWSAFGTPLYSNVIDAVAYNGKLIVAGQFTNSFGNGISRWTGTVWESLGSGLDDVVSVLVVHERSLYSGGRFLMAGGKPSHYVARWDDVITPVLVQDLMGSPYQNGFRLTWRLTFEAADGLIGVHVQRAEDSRGPFTNRTPAPLEPWTAMVFEDHDVDPGRPYWYRLVLLHQSGIETVIGPIQALSSHPFPGQQLDVTFTPGSHEPIQIRYSIAQQSTSVRLGIYDVLGRGLLSLDLGLREPGTHLATWDARDRFGHGVPSGVYVARLLAGAAPLAKKFVLVR